MRISLAYPHQLFQNHPAIRDGQRCLLLEDPMFFGNDSRWPMPMHKQKLVLHRASMAAYAEAGGKSRKVIENPGGKDIDGIAWLDSAIPEKCTAIDYCDPVDDVVHRRLRKLAENRGIELHCHPSPNFLTPGDFLKNHTGDKRKPFMAKFYQAQRIRMDILVEDGREPTGGQWSFDAENRKKLPAKATVPPAPATKNNRHVERAIAHVEKHFPDHPGEASPFRWATTHEEADAWMDEFFADRFENFGIYEDAISRDHAYINHSALTPMLNIGLLDPQAIVAAALRAGQRNPDVPLNSLEGFIRQVIGWREFMAGIYRHRGTAIRTRNFWEFTRPMPAAFYDGTTGIPPIDRVIRQVLRDGYCHHIERLMVLGNFMVLCRIRPDDVYRWFMEFFVDAYDWVMVPNVYGMSQFADGGTFTTKPYISGSNYILKMSDEKKGDWCAVWDGLFWSFIGDHQEFFLRNPRLSMMVRNWTKMSPEKQRAHRKSADDFLVRLR